MTHKDKTYTIKEVADFLNISNQMVYNLIRDRKIEAFKVGSAIRVLHSDLLKYIEKQKMEFHQSDDPLENSNENVFQVQNLCFHREEFQLKNINMEFPRGKILTILGASGSGKTMLLKALAGLNNIDKGAVFLGSKNLTTLSPQERNIGFVFEDYALMPHRSGRGNIRFPLEVLKKKKTIIDPMVDSLASDLNLSPENLDQLIRELPEGIKQLIAIARADIRDIDILMMDEPLARLDTQVRLKMRSFLKDLVNQMGKTTIISLHDPETAMALSDYLAIVDQGKLIQFGEAHDVYRSPNSPIVFEMTSRYPVNSIELTISQGKIINFDLESDKADGDYKMYFRADEVVIDASGLKASIQNRHVLDGSHILAECQSDAGDLQLILPMETQEEFSFKPLYFSLF